MERGPEKVTLVKCPGTDCNTWLPENDLAAQSAHMQQCHPDIILERIAESAQWDGWEPAD